MEDFEEQAIELRGKMVGVGRLRLRKEMISLSRLLCFGNNVACHHSRIERSIKKGKLPPLNLQSITLYQKS